MKLRRNSSGLCILLFFLMRIAWGDSLAHSQYSPLLLTVTINQQNIPTPILFLQDAKKNIWVAKEDLKNWRLDVAYKNTIVYDNKLYCSLNTFEGLQYQLNLQTLSIDIVLPAAYFQSTRLTINQEATAHIPPAAPGGFFNYDTSAETQSDHTSQVGGIFEAGIFNRYGVGTTNFLLQQSNVSNAVNNNAIRLTSTWTHDDPDKMHSFRIGDTYTQAGMWGQSVGFGGIQFASNFNTQPNFVTSPLPSTTGAAVLPSTINLYVNNALISSRNVNPGPFDVTNIPIVNGYGELTVVTTDLLGRQQTYTLPYYGTSTMLKPGLHNYSYEMGFVRKNLGSSSADYGQWLLSGTDTVGITNHITGQWHAEVLAGQQTVGLGANYLWSTLGIWNMAGAVSRDNGTGVGGLLQLGFQHNNAMHHLNWGSNIQVTTPHFTYLGLQSGQLAPSVQEQSFIGFSLPYEASLGISYTLQNNRSSDNASLLNLSYSKTFFKKWALGVTVLTNIGGARSNGVFLTLNRTLDEHTNFNLNTNSQNGSNQTAIQINRPLPLGTGYGYNASIGNNQTDTDYQATLNAQNTIGTYTVGAARQAGNQGYRAEVAGSIVYLGGHTYLSRQMTNSFAVVETGVPNIHVYEFNQDVGKTDKNGNILLPDLMPYQHNMISIDSKDLPLNTTIDSTQMQAIPYYRSGALVKFPIKISRNATLTVIDQNNKFVPLSTVATINQQSEPFLVGEEGQLFLAGLEENNKIRLHLGETVCQFQLKYPKTTDPLPDLGVYKCY